LFLEIAGTSIYFGLSRPRPYGVTIISAERLCSRP
jgi:hypothetical protein